MADPPLWELMQRIETCRYRAEPAYGMGTRGSLEFQCLLHEVSRQWLQLADQRYALSKGAPLNPISPLPGWTAFRDLR